MFVIFTFYIVEKFLGLG